MSFGQALVKAVNETPFCDGDAERVNTLRANAPIPIDFYLGDLSSQYPPRDLDDLLELIDNIENNARLSQQEQALTIFYLFLAYDNSRNGKGMAEYYAKELFLPVSWQNYAKSLWELEYHRFDNSLALLGTFPAPKPVISSYITCLASSPRLLCLFFDTHRQYLDHDNLSLYIESLCEQALYFNVLEIMRGYSLRAADILTTIGEHAATLKDGKALSALLAVPFTQEEWAVIQKHIYQQPKDSPAAKLSLARALHLGDLAEIHKAKDVPAFELLTKSYDDY